MKTILVGLGLASSLALANCDDFSGEWSGHCSTDGAAAVEDALGLKQETCAAIWIGDERLEFGKTLTIPKDTEDYDQVATIRPEWGGKSAFDVSYESVATAKGSGQKLFSAKGVLTVSLAADVLKTQQDVTQTQYLSAGGTKVETTKQVCQYRK